MMVSYDNEYSPIFKTTVGVRQEGIVLPKLFSIYIEELLTVMENSEMGVKINEMKLEIIGYADDILLISNTKKDMKKKLKLLEKFEIKFNPIKTTMVIFNKSFNKKEDTRMRLTLDNEPILITDKFRYLGIELEGKFSNITHINMRKKLTIAALTKLRIVKRNS